MKITDIINGKIIPALNKIGSDFEAGRAFLPQCKIMVGGAVLTHEYTKKINADFYAKDDMDGVKIAENFYREDC